MAYSMAFHMVLPTGNLSYQVWGMPCMTHVVWDLPWELQRETNPMECAMGLTWFLTMVPWRFSFVNLFRHSVFHGASHGAPLHLME